MSEKVGTVDDLDTLRETADELGIDWPRPPEVVRREVVTADGAVSAVAWGDGPAESALLHGRAPTQSARSWDGVALDWGAPTIAIDLPGHGFSALRSDRRYTPRLIAGAVAQTIEELVPTPTLVVGVSFGGLTTIALAALRPDLLRGIVLVDVLPWIAGGTASAAPEEPAATPPPPIESFNSRQEIVDGLVPRSPRSRASLTRTVIANTTQRADGRWVWRFDPGIKVAVGDLDLPGLWDDLLGVQVPVLLVRGGASPVVSDDAVAALGQKRPDIPVTTVAGSGHEIHDERPRELAKLLKEFRSTLV